jgi:hypothetical protein
MKQIFLFIFSIVFACNSFGQIEFNSKFKGIKPQTIQAKPIKKKDISSQSTVFKLNIPKIVAPNVFKETNIFGTKPKVDNSFAIGAPANNFSMIQKNKFDHKLGDVYQDIMTKDLSKTMITEGLKEDKSLLDRTDRDLGEYRTKSDFFVFRYRDYGLIDGDLINVYLNSNIFRSRLYLNDRFGEFRIPLTVGFNIIELVVASTGDVGGNTAELYVLDDVNKTVTTQYWNNLALGVKIKMIVVKE